MRSVLCAAKFLEFFLQPRTTRLSLCCSTDPRTPMGKNKGGGGGSKRGGKGGRAERAASALPDQKRMANFARSLRLSGLKLFEVERDGNCFFRAIATGLGEHQGCHASYRERVVSHMEAHPDDYTPFLTFGEGDEEDDADFEQYLSRMRRDGEWAGQPELLAAVQALRVHLVVYQEERPSYRIECADRAAGCVRVSYHDGEHYNAVLQPAAEEARGGAGFGAEGAAGAKGGASRNKGNGKGGGGPGGGGGGGGNGKGGGSSRGGGGGEAEGGGSCGVADGDAEGDGGSEMGEAAAEAAVRSGCSFEVSAEQVGRLRSLPPSRPLPPHLSPLRHPSAHLSPPPAPLPSPRTPPPGPLPPALLPTPCPPPRPARLQRRSRRAAATRTGLSPTSRRSRACGRCRWAAARRAGKREGMAEGAGGAESQTDRRRRPRLPTAVAEVARGERARAEAASATARATGTASRDSSRPRRMGRRRWLRLRSRRRACERRSAKRPSRRGRSSGDRRPPRRRRRRWRGGNTGGRRRRAASSLFSTRPCDDPSRLCYLYQLYRTMRRPSN